MKKLGIVIAVMAITAAWSLAVCQAGEDDYCPIAIKGITGESQYRRNGMAEWPESELDVCLFHGDQVRTQAGGRVAMLMPDETQMRLNELSTITIDVAYYDSGRRTVEMVELGAGEVWANVVGENRVFEVKTPAAIAGVRGTEFTVVVLEDGGARVNVLSGVVAVFNELGEQLARAGEAIEALLDQIPGLPLEFDIDLFRNQLEDWKDAVEIGKILDAKIDGIKDDVKGKVTDKIPGGGGLKF